MEKLTNTTRPGVLSFVGHTPGFWPQESLVCIALNEKVSARPFASTTPADPARNSPTHARDLRPDGRHQCCIHHLRRLHQRNHPTPDRPTPTPAASPRSPESSPGRASPSGTASSSETRPPPPTTAGPGTNLTPARQLHPNKRGQRRFHVPRQLRRTHHPDHPSSRGQEAAQAAAVERGYRLGSIVGPVHLHHRLPPGGEDRVPGTRALQPAIACTGICTTAPAACRWEQESDRVNGGIECKAASHPN